MNKTPLFRVRTSTSKIPSQTSLTQLLYCTQSCVKRLEASQGDMMRIILVTLILLVLQVFTISTQSIASVIDDKASQTVINYGDPLLSNSSSSSIINLESNFDISSDSDSGDALCPRNREEAIARGRHCLRKCKTDADCISSRKRCLCDGLCGWSCVRPGKTRAFYHILWFLLCVST